MSADHGKDPMLEQGKSVRRKEWQRGTLSAILIGVALLTDCDSILRPHSEDGEEVENGVK